LRFETDYLLAAAIFAGIRPGSADVIDPIRPFLIHEDGEAELVDLQLPGSLINKYFFKLFVKINRAVAPLFHL